MITNALADAVVAVNVAYLACLGGNAAAYDRVAVVLGGDKCSVKREILYRLVAAAVTVLQLLGLGAVCQRKELMPEADAERGYLSRDKLAEVCSFVLSAGSPGPLEALCRRGSAPLSRPRWSSTALR